jgi:hypothetical protein
MCGPPTDTPGALLWMPTEAALAATPFPGPSPRPFVTLAPADHDRTIRLSRRLPCLARVPRGVIFLSVVTTFFIFLSLLTTSTPYLP